MISGFVAAGLTIRAFLTPWRVDARPRATGLRTVRAGDTTRAFFRDAFAIRVRLGCRTAVRCRDAFALCDALAARVVVLATCVVFASCRGFAASAGMADAQDRNTTAQIADRKRRLAFTFPRPPRDGQWQSGPAV
ncbi:MAG: hypothetical protein AB7S57_25230 [Acetobacteraceae bacterium]